MYALPFKRSSSHLQRGRSSPNVRNCRAIDLRDRLLFQLLPNSHLSQSSSADALKPSPSQMTDAIEENHSVRRNVHTQSPKCHVLRNLTDTPQSLCTDLLGLANRLQVTCGAWSENGMRVVYKQGPMALSTNTMFWALQSAWLPQVRCIELVCRHLKSRSLEIFKHQKIATGNYCLGCIL